VVGLLLHDGGVLCDVPAGGALKGVGQQFIDEPGHGFSPGPCFVVEDAHQITLDAGRVVGSPGYKLRDRTAMFRTIIGL
jgi:hypothetical protein